MDLYQPYAPLFERFGFQEVPLLKAAWQEAHRRYHTEKHLNTLLQAFEQGFAAQKTGAEERDLLCMTAFFHDVVYDPTRGDNEEQSAAFLEQYCAPSTARDTVKRLILETKTHKASCPLSALFIEEDMRIVCKGSIAELLEWEKQILAEFQWVDYGLYKMGRLALLRKFVEDYPENAENLRFLIHYLENFRPKIGVYPGSFNPFHNGHLNILEKAERVFDKIIVARGINPDKDLAKSEKIDLKVLKYRQFENFQGFLTDYLTSKEKDADITLVRGLRNGDDLAYEVNQLRYMEEMKDIVKVIFIPCDQQYGHISSSGIRNLDKIDPNFSKKYLPE